MIEHIITDDIVDRCLAVAEICIELGNDCRANALMKAEFREIAREVSHWQLSGEMKADLFLVPMEEELTQRHGPEIGRTLYSDFIDAFWLQTWTEIPLDLERLARSQGWMTDWHQQVQADLQWRREITEQYFSASLSEN